MKNNRVQYGIASFAVMVIFNLLFSISLLFASRLGSELIYNGDRLFYFLIALGVAFASFLFVLLARNVYRSKGRNIFNEGVAKWGPFISFAVLFAAFLSLYFGYGRFSSVFDETNMGDASNFFTFLFVGLGSIFSALISLLFYRRVRKAPKHHAVLAYDYVDVDKQNEDKKPFGLAKIINPLTPFVLCVYSLMVLLPWIKNPNDFLFETLNNGLISYIYRAIEAAFFVVWMVLIMVANKKAPAIGKWALFILIGGVLVFSVFMQDKTFTYVFMKKDETITLEAVVTLKDVFLHYLNFFFGLFFAFSMLYIVPIAKCGGHKKNALLWLFLFIGIISIAYSFFAERDSFRNVFADLNKYFATASSFYKSKNDFGFVVLLSMISALVLAFDKRRLIRVLLIIYALLAVVFEGMINCTTSLAAGIMILLSLFVWFFIKYVKKHPIAISVTYGLLIAFAVVAILFITLPELYTMRDTFEKLNKILFKSRFTNRIDIWEHFFQFLDGNKGFSGNGLISLYYDPMVRGRVAEGIIHNGYLNIFAMGGVVYLSFYVYLVFAGFDKVRKLGKYGYKPLSIAIVASIIGFFVYCVAETHVIGLDSSLASILPTFVLFTLPSWKFNDPKIRRMPQDI